MRTEKADLKRYQDCFNRNGSMRSLDSLEWMYMKSGQPIVTFAVDAQKNEPDYLAGIYATLPVRFRIGRDVVRGAQSLDTMTDKKYRNLGLFTRLATEVFNRCQTEGVELIYGFPNGNSAHGFFSKLGWEKLDPVPFLIKPLRLRYFTAKLPVIKKLNRFVPDLAFHRGRSSALPADKEIRRLQSFEDSCNDIWTSFAADGVKVAIERDANYLNWRYCDKPREPYEKFGCFDQNGKLEAFIVYIAKKKHGGQIGYIMELLHRPANAASAQLLLDFAVADLAKQKCDAILAWCLDHSITRARFRKSGFFVMPERIRPIELHFGARGFSPETHAVARERTNWYVSYSDSDTV